MDFFLLETKKAFEISTFTTEISYDWEEKKPNDCLSNDGTAFVCVSRLTNRAKCMSDQNPAQVQYGLFKAFFFTGTQKSELIRRNRITPIWCFESDR